ncbi:MAG: class F sortase [Candidatus Nanopelagicaceae bacterium]
MRSNIFVKFVRIICAVLLVLIYLIAPNSAIAAPVACVRVKPAGPTVGEISVAGVVMPIKPFIYPAGGIMEPQGSTLMAGLSQRHMPLSSSVGTSVVVWHRDYKGCVNRLNILFSKKKGDLFQIEDENGESRNYRIALKQVINKGDYQKSWFTLIGPRQIALFTCTGKFKNGHYEDNLVLIAKPI